MPPNVRSLTWKVMVTLQINGKRCGYDPKAGFNIGSGAFGRPTTAWLGESVALGEGFSAATFFAEGEWANGEDKVNFPDAHA